MNEHNYSFQNDSLLNFNDNSEQDNFKNQYSQMIKECPNDDSLDSDEEALMCDVNEFENPKSTTKLQAQAFD